MEVLLSVLSQQSEYRTLLEQLQKNQTYQLVQVVFESVAVVVEVVVVIDSFESLLDQQTS